jgi:hypothetical protein
MGQLKAESKAQAQYVFVCTRPVLISSRSREVAHVLEWRWRGAVLLAMEVARHRVASSGGGAREAPRPSPPSATQFSLVTPLLLSHPLPCVFGSCSYVRTLGFFDLWSLGLLILRQEPRILLLGVVLLGVLRSWSLDSSILRQEPMILLPCCHINLSIWGVWGMAC